MMSFSKRLLQLRKKQNISQSELAKKVDIHPNVLGRYERKEATPSIEMAAKLADTLGVSLDYLVGKTDQELDQDLINKILSIQKLPDEDQHCILYTLDGLLKNAKTKMAYSS